MRPAIIAIALLAGASIPAPAADEITVEHVRFERGRSGATLHGTLKGRQTVDYRLGARAGQTLRVKLTSDNGANYFNVNPPGSPEEAIFIGSTSGGEFSGTLPKDGDYTVRVYLMRNEARRGGTATYDLDLSITGP